ncbi:MAG: hypothetical protein HRT51_03170 [Colwellia sp.]|nr:hypothetical protein [Colwellia sp.]
MLRRIIAWQQHWATQKTLVVFAIGYIIFPVYLLPQILPEGRPLDLHLYYSAEDAYNLIKSYGEYNRARYIVGSLTIDIIYPLYYATFLGLILRFFIEKIDEQHGKWQYFSLSPYIIMLIDFCENLTVITLLSIFPQRNEYLAELASVLTSTKWLLFFMVSILLVYFPVKYYRKGK